MTTKKFDRKNGRRHKKKDLKKKMEDDLKKNGRLTNQPKST